MSRVGAVLLLAALAGCNGRNDDNLALAPVPVEPPLPFEPMTQPPRRSMPVHLLERKGHRCRLYTVEGESRAPRGDVLCPRDLRDGESIRLSGEVCMLAGPDPSRALPVICPKRLLRLAFPE